MLGVCDLKGMCGCTEGEIDAIAMHEHVSDAVASEIAFDLIHSNGGVPRLRRIIAKDIETAEKLGNFDRATKLKAVLEHFLITQRSYYQGVIATIRH